MYPDEEWVRSGAIVGIDRAELIRILELSISAGCFCHITDADSHGIVSDKALSTLRILYMQTKWVPRRSSSGFDLQTHRRRRI